MKGSILPKIIRLVIEQSELKAQFTTTEDYKCCIGL
jgi:hypothetical protein